MRKTHSLYTGSALLICLVALRSSHGEEIAPSSQNQSVRVMTFNIRYNEPQDGPNAWPKRKKLVASMIRFHRADIVGLQEALIGQLRDLEKELPGYAWCGAARGDGIEDGEFSAILYHKERFELLRQATFWYSDTPEVVSKGWDSLPRVVTWAEFRSRTGKESFFVFNTHLGFTREHRQKSIPLLRNQIAKVAGDAPVVLTGDFNMMADSGQYRALVAPFEKESRSLRDAFQITETPHHGPSGTWNGFGKEIVKGRRIDYIFVNDKFRVRAHGALADTFDGRFPSDHLPVLAEIMIR